MAVLYLAAVGRYKESHNAVTLSENKQLLKERLRVIIYFRERSKAVTVLTCVLTLFIIFGAVYIGVYSVAATSRYHLKFDVHYFFT